MSIRFDVITIFPNIFDSYLNESMIKRARAKRLIDICVHDLRKFSEDKSRSRSDRGSSTRWSGHKKEDDRPDGGGPRLGVKLEPPIRAISSLKLKVKKYKIKV